MSKTSRQTTGANPMTDITKLADQWRGYHRTMGSDAHHWADSQTREWCADQLTAALPVWTLITDNPDTWPDDGVVMVCGGMGDYLPRATYFNHPDEIGSSEWLNSYWRPLCDLDHPPQDKP